MNTKPWILVLSTMGVSLAALAQTGEMSAPQKVDQGVVKAAKPAPSTVDRKALQKDAAAARKAGTTTEGECGPEQKADAGACKKAPVQAGKTRQEVKQEAIAAAKAGKISQGDKP